MWPFTKRNEFDVRNFGSTMGYVPYKAPKKETPPPPSGGGGGSGTKWWQVALPALSVALSSIALIKSNNPDLQQYDNLPQTVYVPYSQPQETENNVMPINIGIAFFTFLILLAIIKDK
jgi:hypothetical protein